MILKTAARETTRSKDYLRARKCKLNLPSRKRLLSFVTEKCNHLLKKCRIKQAQTYKNTQKLLFTTHLHHNNINFLDCKFRTKMYQK